MSGKKNLTVACMLFISIIFFNAFAWAEDSRRTFFKVNNLYCGACIGKIILCPFVAIETMIRFKKN